MTEPVMRHLVRASVVVVALLLLPGISPAQITTEPLDPFCDVGGFASCLSTWSAGPGTEPIPPASPGEAHDWTVDPYSYLPDPGDWTPPDSSSRWI